MSATERIDMLRSMRGLSERERFVIARIYGPDEHTEDKLAEDLQVDQSLINRIKQSAIRKMRTALNISHALVS
jgi:DNA-directed RNA polymerase specialized sigma subunit